MSADPTTGPADPRRPGEPTDPETPEVTVDDSAADPTAEPAAPAESSEPSEPTEPAQPVDPTAPSAAETSADETRTATPEPVEPLSPDDDVVAPTAGARPALDETHVAAIPQQGGDDPFAEVDGGDGRDEARTAVVPTADEDDALRDERARRFGRPRENAEEPTTTFEEPAQERTAAVPLAAAGAGAVATVGETESTRTMPTTTTAGEEDPFEDFDEGPASRAAAHWWSLFFSVLFTPLAWYLIADGGERTSFNLTNGGPLNLAGPLELAGGAVCLFIVLLAARWSSIGAILVGSVSFLLGAAFIGFNSEAMDLVREHQGTVVQALNQVGQNIVDHMLADAQTGRLAIYGLVLIMVGVVSHGARRQGRREERRKAAIGA